MNWDQLREMRAAGFEVGSHGVHHRMLAKLPQDQMEEELMESKATLERELGASAVLLSYPVGGDLAFDGGVIKATVAAGYRAACSYICGTNLHSATNRYALFRLPVERTMGMGWFAAMHGYSHAMEAPGGDPGSYMLGFLAATGLLQAAGLGLGWVVERLVGNFGLRALGGLILAGGALVLVTN